MSSLRLSLRLPANPDAPGAARHALDGLDLYVGEERCRTIQLLISELVTNSIRHAGLRYQDLIDVIVTASDEMIRVEVCDPGEGFDDAAVEPDPSLTSGWGLLLTDRLTQRWGVGAIDGTRVWFEIPVSQDDDGLRRRRRRSLEDPRAHRTIG